MQLSPLLVVFVGGEIVDMISNSGAVAKLVLLFLLAFSLLSWAIILTKWSLLRRARTQSGRFVRAFRKAQRLQDIAAVADQFKPSPLVGVFEGGYEEYRRQIAAVGGIRNLVSIQRGMQIGASEEITRLERNMPWLAITAAVTPFVGLFGTVWGIIDAFHGLGTAGAATLRAVAPGISEALITTAAGLAAAIPAVIAYNLIGSSIREFAARSDDFALEVLNAVENSQAQIPAASSGRREALMAFTTSNGRTQTALADINITPLVDVVLVLLIIFMVTAPVLQSGIDVSVPKTRYVKQITEERLVITINKDQRVFLGNDAININEIGTKLRQRIRDPRNQSIFVRADENVPFGAFATIMDAVKQAGFANVSIVTQPLEQSGKH